MGYSQSQKVYKLYALTNQSFFVKRHVVFKEDLFTFKHVKGVISPIFPILDLLSPESHLECDSDPEGSSIPCHNN